MKHSYALSSLALMAILLTTACQSLTAPAAPLTFRVRAHPVTDTGENVKPFVLASPGGGLAMVWARKTNAQTRVLFATSADGRTFGEPVEVSGPGMELDLGAESGPQMIIGADHAIHVVWAAGTLQPRPAVMPTGRKRMSPRPTNLNIYLSTSRDGGQHFTPPLRINDDTGDAEHRFPTIATDARGTITVAWLDKRGQNDQRPDFSRVYCARSLDGGRSFAANVDATQGQTHGICHCCKLALASSPSTGIHIAFRNDVNDTRDMYLVQSRDGGRRFTSPTALENTHWVIPGCPMSGPSLAFDHANRLHAVWPTGGNVPGRPAIGPATGDSHKILYRSTATGPTLFVAYGTHPRLTIDSANAVYLAWETDGLKLARLDQSISDITVSPPEALASYPSLSAADGLVTIAWQQMDANDHTQIWLATIASP